MKNKLISLLLVITFLVMAYPIIVALASDVTGALYVATIRVTNNGTLANYVATNLTLSSPNLIAGGYMNSSANNTAMLDPAENDAPFMPGYDTNPWCFMVETIGADSYINYELYTAESTGGDIVYFPGTNGMSVNDDVSLELGNNFEVESMVWVDTSSGSGKYIVEKPDAFLTYVSGASEITSAILGYPSVAAVNGGSTPVDSSHTVNLPAGIESGDLLLIFFASDGSPVITFPNEGVDWFQLFETDYTQVTFGAWYRIADGGEGASITVSTSASQEASYTSYRIIDYSGTPEVGSSVTGTNANPDPPNLTPSWGSSDNLWFAICGYDRDVTVSSYPTFYTDGRNDVGGTPGGCGVGSARRTYRGASDNPLNFVLSGADEWIANTVAVRPTLSPLVSVTATGVASGEHEIKTTADGVNLKIYIDDVEEDSQALAGVSVTDESDNWQFCVANTTLYMDYTLITVSGVPISRWEWEYDTTFEDSIGSNDATPTFRTASSDADVSAEAIEFEPVSEAQAPAWSLSQEAATWVTAPNITGNFTTVVTPTLPGEALIEDISAATGTPVQLPWTTLSAFVILACSLVVSWKLRQSGSRSLMVKWLLIAVLMGIFVALEIMDLWMLIFFVLMALAINAMSKPGEVV